MQVNMQVRSYESFTDLLVQLSELPENIVLHNSNVLHASRKIITESKYVIKFSQIFIGEMVSRVKTPSPLCCN